MTRVLLSVAVLFAFHLLGGGRTFSFSYEVMHNNRELLSYLFTQFPNTFYDWQVRGFQVVLFSCEFIVIFYLFFTAILIFYRKATRGSKTVVEIGSPLAPTRRAIPDGHGSYDPHIGSPLSKR